MKALIIFLMLMVSSSYGQSITVTVDGNSMSPAVDSGELVTFIADTPARNDVALFTLNGRYMVKRIVAIPEDDLRTIHCIGDSTFTLNDGRVLLARPLSQDAILGDSVLVNGIMVDSIKINGVMVDSIKIATVTARLGFSSVHYLPTIVPSGKYVVKGDSPHSRNDSRRWGFVDGEDILGVTQMEYIPHWKKGK